MSLPAANAALLISALFVAMPLAAAPFGAGLVLVAQTDPIKGSDTMGDKGRSGPDGWIQAPISRDAAPSGTHKAPGEPSQGKASTASKSQQGKQLSPGDDPGTVVDPTKTSTPAQAPK